MRTGRGRGGKRAGCGSGGSAGAVRRGQAGSAGSTGLIAGALRFVRQLLPSQTSQTSHAGEINSSSRQIPAASTDSRVAQDAGPDTRKSKGRPLVAWFANQLCVGCGLCAEVCPAGAIAMVGAASLDARKCTACGKCVEACPQGAIVLRRA